MELLIQTALAAISAIFTGLAGFLIFKLKKRELLKEKNLLELLKREEATNEALRALCRDRILQGYRYYKSNGGITAQDFETMTKLYNAYHDLNGNGTITVVYEKICELPLKDGV